ncbi:MAG: hypothetical protein ACREXK_08280 [Gammaproteobacteria bacterium]
MTEHPENLVLEQLRAIRGDIAEIKGDLHFLRQRVGALEQHMATLITMIPTYNDELEKLRKRVSRIERRLELTD